MEAPGATSHRRVLNGLCEIGQSSRKGRRNQFEIEMKKESSNEGPREGALLETEKSEDLEETKRVLESRPLQVDGFFRS